MKAGPVEFLTKAFRQSVHREAQILDAAENRGCLRFKYSLSTQVLIGHGRLRRFQSCAFHLIVVAVQHLPVCIQKVHLALAGRELVP